MHVLRSMYEHNITLYAERSSKWYATASALGKKRGQKSESRQVTLVHAGQSRGRKSEKRKVTLVHLRLFGPDQFTSHNCYGVVFIREFRTGAILFRF